MSIVISGVQCIMFPGQLEVAVVIEGQTSRSDEEKRPHNQSTDDTQDQGRHDLQ